MRNAALRVKLRSLPTQDEKHHSSLVSLMWLFFLLPTQNMVRVERRVMKKLFWSHDPVMSSVYASEDWVQHLRDTVGTALERAVAPAAHYLETLEPFVEFLNVDGKSSRPPDNSIIMFCLLWRPPTAGAVPSIHRTRRAPKRLTCILLQSSTGTFKFLLSTSLEII